MSAKARNGYEEAGCCPEGGAGSLCRVESLISVDERGQMVLPKDFRERAGIRAGDKLALVSWERDGEVCCMVLMRAEELGDLVRERLGPTLRDML
ncbi:MAG: AbrB/MazE/SpoVT family DNA-binding domain-containing protein [Actinobacteria bacterium]|nr:AbrB/MazE/SpoVT family DNA-binding domain-containing protein [Actinomycetota bacterium]